jgi:DNA ligase (NAD+)
MEKVNVFFDMEHEENIIEQLKEYDRLYYTDGTSPVDDLDYDNLKEYAKSLAPGNPYFEEVGTPVIGEKVSLPYVLGSLNKVKIDNVQDWLNKQPDDIFFITEKLDGVSFMVTYENGKVSFAATRGDSSTGRDITDKAKIFCKPIKSKNRESYRAEAMLIDDAHKKLGFKTRRNGAAGILNRDYLKDEEFITPIFYESLNYGPGTEEEKYNFMLEHFGVSHVPNSMIYNKRTTPISAVIMFLEMVKDNGLYEVDGLVITPMDYEREDVEFPDNKVAFKMNEEGIEVEVDHVEWKVSRTGRIIPVVNIKPTDFQGVTVERATGFNAKFIMDNKIGKGSIVKMVRSGDVIPYITETVSPGELFIPNSCSSCGEFLEMKGVDLVCKNTICQAQSFKHVEHFLVTMGAENITQKTLVKLGIDTIEKAYEIDEFEIAGVEGFGVKRGRQIVAEIESTLQTTPDRFIRALGISNIGKTASKLIYDRFRPDCENDDHFMEIAWNLKPSQLEEIDGIGEVIAENYFKNIRQVGEGLFSFLINKGLKWEQVARSLAGLTFCMTGKGEYGRKELQLMIEKKGGAVRSMSKSVDYLVTADINSQSGKSKKAREYNIQIISYEDLMEMLN